MSVAPAPTVVPELATRRRPPAALVAAGLASVVLLAPMRSLFDRGVTAQDDGLLLAYPDLVLRGAAVYRDFDTVYGPLTSWVVAAAFAMAGPEVAVMRAVGLLYRVLVLVAVYLVLRPRTAAGAVVAVTVLAGVLTVTDVMPSASLGSSATGLLALASADRARAANRPTPVLLVAGLLAGLATGFRVDAALPTLLGLAPFLAATTTRRRAVVTIGATAGLVPLALAAAAAGVRVMARNVLFEPLLVSASGRRLPLGSLPLPMLAAVTVTVALVVTALLAGYRLRARDRALLALGGFGLGQLPYLLSRADLHHLGPVLVAPLAGGVLLATQAGRRRVPMFASATVVVVTVGGVLGPLWAAGVQDSLVPDPVGTVRAGERSVPFVPERASDMQAGVDAVRALTRDRPGATLAVVPGDTSRAIYNDTFLYFLLPDLRPATTHLEMNPGVANGPASTLAKDVAHADVVVTDDAWNTTSEPTTANGAGSPAANEVLGSSFSLVGRWDTVAVLKRHDPD